MSGDDLPDTIAGAWEEIESLRSRIVAERQVSQHRQEAYDAVRKRLAEVEARLRAAPDPAECRVTEEMFEAMADELGDAQALLRKLKEGRCETCGANLYSGPPDCFGCGAPVCCQSCCSKANAEARMKSLEELNREALQEIERLQGLLDRDLVRENGGLAARLASAEVLIRNAADHPCGYGEYGGCSECGRDVRDEGHEERCSLAAYLALDVPRVVRIADARKREAGAMADMIRVVEQENEAIGHLLHVEAFIEARRRRDAAVADLERIEKGETDG